MLKYEPQVSDSHCVPACLSMLLPQLTLTQEEIGDMVNTDKDGTYIEDVQQFLEMFGYKLSGLFNVGQYPRIIDYVDFDGEDHWIIDTETLILDPYLGRVERVNFYHHFHASINDRYVLEELYV